MRTYLSMSSFGRAVMLGTGVTLMSVPRIVEGGLPLDLYIPAALDLHLFLNLIQPPP